MNQRRSVKISGSIFFTTDFHSSPLIWFEKSGSISEDKRSKKWSVSVLVARFRGKEEDRVQLPNGPLQLNQLSGPACRWRRLILARSVRSVRLRSGPLFLPCECDGRTVVFGTTRRGSTPWWGTQECPWSVLELHATVRRS